MWQQIWAIIWAQFRITRNHLPRTGVGVVAGWIFSGLWYSLYALLAGFLAAHLPEIALSDLRKWMPSGLLGVFLFWQLVPLFTLTSGWSLQLNKLRIYPVKDGALFGIEVLLRFTSAPEMVLVLAGATIGLLRHPQTARFAPLALLLYIPFNLLLQLGLRDLVLHAFERNRFREVFTVIVVSIGLLPNLLFRTRLGVVLKPYFFSLAGSRATPWAEASGLALGGQVLVNSFGFLLWVAVISLFARWMFAKSLLETDAPGPVSASRSQLNESRRFFSTWPARVFRDPLAALLQKELQSLVRMPKFRVLFGMACLLGAVVFIPAALNSDDPGAHFMSQNLVGVVNLYGLLLLSDALLLNSLGLDRAAAQVYFVSPISIGTVLKAKNLAAIVFVILQTIIIVCVALLARATITWLGLTSGLLASAVVTVFLLAIGNLTSVTMARPIDPKQTFKKQAGAKMQLWFLASSLSLIVLVGFAFLARFAFGSDWVFLGVLVFELGVGLLVYRFSLESAVERAGRERENIVQALSQSASPVSFG